jgi:heterogeneous nuclear rnp K-like protein 2
MPVREAPVSQKIAIRTVCSGCVLGKGGSIIKELRAQSGTNISLADPDPETPNERIVTITGPPSNIQHAIYLIREAVEKYVPPAGMYK